MESEHFQKLYNYSLKLLSFRPRSEAETKEKLTRYSVKKSIPIQTIEGVIEKLISQNLINDEDFVKWWIDQRRSFRPKGIFAIALEMQGKGISKELIDRVLSNQGIGKEQEFDSAFQLAEKKIRSYGKLPIHIMRKKIGNLLFRRGFDWDIIYKVIDALLEKS